MRKRACGGLLSALEQHEQGLLGGWCRSGAEEGRGRGLLETVPLLAPQQGPLCTREPRTSDTFFKPSEPKLCGTGQVWTLYHSLLLSRHCGGGRPVLAGEPMELILLSKGPGIWVYWLFDYVHLGCSPKR